MTMTDPIADMLTRLRNANQAYHDDVAMPYSKLKAGVAEILQQEGYITSWKVEDNVDAEGADVRPDGQQIGEIVVRGNTVMDGYYLEPEATESTIRNGWLHTGDMATIDAARHILHTDRSKALTIRSGGHTP